ncbi:nucleotidyl transferase AbiEii/AbiGii toxin family protein [Corynebacterium anserum]|uniref:nucleotidyl transferase AbiEii/AbiGii toxin family protein n=1 Tax=Corynebacterium anserum TaxID=2684406 RepID=UPI00164143CF|nr:nucleotidyl transferase AbiEii/AbiGii toxin family protein [Corynebacterium anserum]
MTHYPAYWRRAMDDKPVSSRLNDQLGDLKSKTKQPASATILRNWITQAEAQLGEDAKGGRLGWLVASSVAIAAVQRAVDENGRRLFLLKGGTLLQHRLNATARATKDVDGLIRGDMDAFFAALEEVLDEPWGPLELRRGEVKTINVPTKITKPRRFNITIDLKGRSWRSIDFEISPDEAGIGAEQEAIEPPLLSGFGLPTPDVLVGITMRFQIAQKLHAVSDPHEPPTFKNDRARDLVDLILLRDLITATGTPTLTEVREAGQAIFDSRAKEADILGYPARSWPPTIIAHKHWGNDYARAAKPGGIHLPLESAVAEINNWISAIDNS